MDLLNDSSLNLNTRQVYITGFSMGGTYSLIAWHLIDISVLLVR